MVAPRDIYTNVMYQVFTPTRVESYSAAGDPWTPGPGDRMFQVSADANMTISGQDPAPVTSGQRFGIHPGVTYVFSVDQYLLVA